jgi:hypothetical protein
MEEHSSSPSTEGLEQLGKHSAGGVVQDYSVAHTINENGEAQCNVNIDRAQLQALGDLRSTENSMNISN